MRGEGGARRMPEATSGVLLTCDCPAMKQFVLKVDEEKRSSLADSFVLRDLDDTHLLLRNDAQILALIHRRIDELQVRCLPLRETRARRIEHTDASLSDVTVDHTQFSPHS